MMLPAVHECACRGLKARSVLVLVLAAVLAPAHGLSFTVPLQRASSSLDGSPHQQHENVLYYAVMQVGSPAQNLTVCIDTGSAALWAAAAPLAQSFNASASLSFQGVGRAFSEKFQSGGIIGALGADTAALGALTVANASLGLVTQASVNLTEAPCAGVLGLARPGMTKQERPLFYRMLDDQTLDAPTFSLWLNPDPAAEPAGSLQLGGSNASLFRGELAPLQVISSKYWMVPLTGAAAGNRSISLLARAAILASSSALCQVTRKDYAQLGRAIPGLRYSSASGAFEVLGGCANISALPNLTLALGYGPSAGNFTLSPQQYLVGSSGTCALGVQPGVPDMLNDTIVLGTNFLRAYYSTYTYNASSRSSSVQLAPAVQPAPGPANNRRRMQDTGYPSLFALPSAGPAAAPAAGPAAAAGLAPQQLQPAASEAAASPPPPEAAPDAYAGLPIQARDVLAGLPAGWHAMHPAAAPAPAPAAEPLASMPPTPAPATSFSAAPEIVPVPSAAILPGNAAGKPHLRLSALAPGVSAPSNLLSLVLPLGPQKPAMQQAAATAPVASAAPTAAPVGAPGHGERPSAASTPQPTLAAAQEAAAGAPAPSALKRHIIALPPGALVAAPVPSQGSAPIQAPSDAPPVAAPAIGEAPRGPAAFPVLAPAQAPMAAAALSLVPAAAAAQPSPPNLAVEALRGGWAQQWALPLQVSDYGDPLFAAYLASVRLSPEQAATLAQPRPPTTPGFGRPVSLVALDEDLDTCLVGWSSAASCSAKGLNDTLCTLMPLFSDVAMAQWACPHKNETQVELPRGSGRYVAMHQHWLLVRPGPNLTLTRGGQQLYNVGLGKCLDVCMDKGAYSRCGHMGNVFLNDCDSSSPTQQWLLAPRDMTNATLAAAQANDSGLTAYQISTYLPDMNASAPSLSSTSSAAPAAVRSCLSTCEAEREAEELSDSEQATSCNALLPTYPSSAALFSCQAQRLPHAVLQGFALVMAPPAQALSN